MLKMTGKGMRNGKPVQTVVFGLSHNNLKRLKAGQPIYFTGDMVGLADVDFLIFAGETEQSMARDVAEVVGPHTVTRIDPRLKD